MRQRVVNQIENRKEFIATDDYVGPDRRAENRDLSEDDLASIKVPNSLRHAATGDESAAPSEERVRAIALFRRGHSGAFRFRTRRQKPIRADRSIGIYG